MNGYTTRIIALLCFNLNELIEEITLKILIAGCVVLGFITGCGSSSDSSTETPTGSETATVNDMENPLDTTTTETNTTDTASTETNTGTVANAAALIGRWQFCFPAPDPDEDRFASGSNGFVFSEDGIFRGYIATYQEPDCQGEETFAAPGLDPIENEQRYTVLGTAITSEGLEAFEVLTQLEGTVDDITYYHIDGDAVFVGEDLGTGAGIITGFTIPYVKQ